MGTKNFSSANDLITFSRSSAGTALRKIAYGSELVTNGTFDTDTTGWTAINATLSVVSGALRVTKTTTNGQARTTFPTIPGKVYALSADLVGRTTAGSTLIYIGSAAGGTDLGIKSFSTATSGSAYVVFRATTEESHIALYSSASTGYEDWDNVSVKEVLFDDASGDLTLFNHPADIPRIEYDADGNVLGLLVEESRTNLVTYSEDFTDASWIKNSTTISANSVVSPDGTQSASTLDAAGTALNALFVSLTHTAGPLTFSIYAKEGTKSVLQVDSAVLGGGAGRANFDLSAGVLGTVDPAWAASIVDVGNGWYRCVASFTGAGGTGNFIVSMQDSPTAAREASSSAGDLYLYGAQFEVGAFPTSYIPTDGATATRSADVASIPVSAFGYNQSEFTLFVEARNSENCSVLSAVADGTTNNRVRLYESGDPGVAVGLVSTNAANVAVMVTTQLVAVDSLKSAIVAKKDDFAAVANGGSVASDTLGDMPSGLTSLTIGAPEAGNVQGAVHIKSIKYYPRRLSNAQLQELTT